MTQQTQVAAPTDGRRDFDFFIGAWKVHHRMLRERLKASTDWEEFGGTTTARRLLDGLGNIDEITLDRESGLTRGMTVRLFDPKTRQWSLYWASSVSGWNWHLPQIGVFTDRRGEFYAHEPFEGKYVFSRFIWSGITPTSCRWEQAFSADGGRTWETNWIMDFERIN
jgi:hypothetical protein